MARGRRNVPLVTAIVATVAALGLLAFHSTIRPLPGVAALEGLAIDARFHLRGPRAPASDRVVIVGLDDATRARFPEVFQTRRGWAKLITALAGYDVKLIALDLFFSAPEVILPDELAQRVKQAAAAPDATQLIKDIAEELRGDEQLATAITNSKRVYLGAFFRIASGNSYPEPAGLEHARHGEAADSGGGGARRPVHAIAADFTLPQIGAGAIGAGALNSFRDDDGITRRVPLAIEMGGREYMPLGLAVALADQNTPNATSYLAGADHVTAAGKELPIGRGASLFLDVLGRSQIPRVSAADVLAGTAPRAALQNNLIFVGFTYAAYDKVSTPLDPIADGVELHATLTENILGGHLLRQASTRATFVATLALCAIVILAQLRRIRRRAYVPPLVALAAIAIYLTAAQIAFYHGTILAVAAPTLLAAITLIAATIGGLATEGREKAHLRAVFSQYVSRQVVDRILADPARARLGGERKELTVLFSDIRGFSALAESMKPETLASFLGEYLTPMTDLVLESGGTLDKYIGDAVMAIWAAPVDMPDHAARACDVALRMLDDLARLNAQWQREDKPAIAIGIGINTGAMAVGNMGSAARFDYTVLGDEVNLGARLEALTKEYGVQILVGEATARTAKGFVFREIDLVRVKGRAGAAPVFELVGRTGKASVDPRWAEALAAYRARDFVTARATFESLANDPAAKAMAARCAELAIDVPPPDWDRVYEQRSK